MSGEKDLKPCPFDAWPAKRIRDTENAARPFIVACTNVACGAETQHHSNESDADREWDRRAIPPGFEMVPEGTIGVLEEIYRWHARDIFNNGLSRGLPDDISQKISEHIGKEKTELICQSVFKTTEAILAANRAAQKDGQL